MKKGFFTLVAICVGTVGIFAQNYDQFYENVPFRMDKVVLPSIPDHTVYLTDFGGVGDGMTSNTKAFAEAINTLSQKGGGKLVVPRGIWITGPIHLKSKINLHLSEGALIYFSDDYEEYPLIETYYEGWKALKATSQIGRAHV